MLFRSNDTATTEIYTVGNTLSLHDALPISLVLLSFLIYAAYPNACVLMTLRLDSGVVNEDLLKGLVIDIFQSNPLFKLIWIDLTMVTFLIGLIIILVTYTKLSKERRRITEEVDTRMARMEREGYIISLDDSYVPFEEDTTIEYLG